MKQKVSLINMISESLSANHFEAIFNVPGFGGSEVLEALRLEGKTKTYINLNEEAAFSISYGVSSNGKRSALLIKSQGFAKALNAITSSLSTEVRSANLIFVFDDSEGKSSDNILPTKNIVKASETPFFVLMNDPSEAIAKAIKISERLRIPVALIVDCKNLQKEFSLKIKTVAEPKIGNHLQLERVACPILTKFQREKLVKKLKGMPSRTKSPGINDIRKILPPNILSGFSEYVKFMNVFKKVRPSFVSGDAGTSGLFAFKPFNCVDTCTYMGGGPGMAIGAMIAGLSDAVCITGDFSFLSAGILGLNEAVLHCIPLKVIIFNNGRAQATGGQDLNPALLKNVQKSFSESIQSINLKEISESQIESTLKLFFRKNELSILIVDV